MTTRSKTLETASREWCVRPADQRFWTLADLLKQTKTYAEESKVKTMALHECRAISPDGTGLVLRGPSGNTAQFQHYSFSQLSNICQAPAGYLRTLPAPLAADCLNNGLALVQGQSKLMFHQNGGLHLRCVTSDRYERIWNYEIAELALALEEQEGWKTPPARPCGLPDVPVRKATVNDILHNSAHPQLGVKLGDDISPAGLYASDHDCFIFQVNENAAIDGGDGEQLYRGVFWSNSEVGAARFRATMFLYESVCGNHLVYGAKTVGEVSIRHSGYARRMFSQAMATVTDRTCRAASEDEALIRKAKQFELGKTPEDIVTLVFGRQLGLSKGDCEQAWVIADRHADQHGGNPRSAWGYAAGITRLSQQQYADRRDVMDRAAGKLLQMAF